MDKPDVQQFVDRWKASGASERANCQLFLSELCDVLVARSLGTSELAAQSTLASCPCLGPQDNTYEFWGGFHSD